MQKSGHVDSNLAGTASSASAQVDPLF